MDEPSPKFSLNKTDWKKIIKGFGIAFTAAFVTDICSRAMLGESLPWKIYLIAAISAGLNAGLKYFKDQN